MAPVCPSCFIPIGGPFIPISVPFASMKCRDTSKARVSTSTNMSSIMQPEY